MQYSLSYIYIIISSSHHIYLHLQLEICISNGLAPDNLFFHGVACNCVKIQLSHLGLDTEFAQCEIQVDEKDWEGVRRKYWHGRNTYYLPIVTWKKMGDE